MLPKIIGKMLVSCYSPYADLEERQPSDYSRHVFFFFLISNGTLSEKVTTVFGTG